MVRLRCSGASCNEDEVQLKIRPWPCRAERGQKRRTRVDLGNGIHTEASGGRGGAGGEVCEDEVHWCLGNSSPEFYRAAARSRRGRFRCPGAQTKAGVCQRGVRD
jgi:hypothetical protein